MSKRHRLLSIKTPPIENLLIQDVVSRLLAYRASGLDAKHFEPKHLPTVPFEIKAVIGGKRVLLKGQCDKLASNEPFIHIEFPGSVSYDDGQEWVDECYERLMQILLRGISLNL